MNREKRQIHMDRKEIIDRINKMLDKLSDSQLQKIYELIHFKFLR